MSEDNPPWKKGWEWLKRNQSDSHLPQQEAVRVVASRSEVCQYLPHYRVLNVMISSQPSSLIPSPTGPRTRLFRKLWGKVTRSRYAPNLGESANSAPTASGSSSRDLSFQTSKVVTILCFSHELYEDRHCRTIHYIPLSMQILVM